MQHLPCNPFLPPDYQRTALLPVRRTAPTLEQIAEIDRDFIESNSDDLASDLDQSDAGKLLLSMIRWRNKMRDNRSEKLER